MLEGGDHLRVGVRLSMFRQLRDEGKVEPWKVIWIHSVFSDTLAKS